MKPNSLVFVSLAVLIAGLSVGCGSHEETNPAAPSPPTAASAAPTPGAPSLDYGDAADLAASGLVVQTFHFKDGCSDGAASSCGSSKPSACNSPAAPPGSSR